MKVLVTGSSGLLGSALKRLSAGSPHAFTFSSKADGDLETKGAAERLLGSAKPDALVHLAAVVGGIKYNMEKPEELRDRNRRINENTLNAARAAGVKKSISILSTCIFPDDAPEPWDESMIHAGEPDRRQWGYAQAKRELDLLGRQISKETGAVFTTIMPSTLFGPNDNFHPEKSHVVSAVISKLQKAKTTGEKPVFWGTGAARREFLYVDDMARVLLWALDAYADPETLIVAPPADASVKELVALVSRQLGYRGEVGWDASKPDGRLTRRTNVAKFRRLHPGFRFTSLEEGLRKAIDDFSARTPNLRGLEPSR